MSGDLPKGWADAMLEEIADINPRHPSNTDPLIPVTFVPMPGLSESGWRFQFTEERPFNEVRKGYTHFAEGDVLLAKITPCMENGKAAIATGLKNGLGCGTTELHVLRPRGSIEPKLIYHFVHQEAFRHESARNFTGTAGQLRVPVSFIRGAHIPLAPLNEQRRIVAKLENLFGKVDACQNRLERMPLILKRFRQSVLAAACSGRLTQDWREDNPHTGSDGKSDPEMNEHPMGWTHNCVGDVLESLKYGTAQKCGYENLGIPVLRIPNVANGTINHNDLKYAKLSSKEIKSLRLNHGDILMIRSNGSVSLVGKCALVREKEIGFAYAGYLIRLRPNRTLVEPEFLCLTLGSYGIRLQIELEARSTSGVNNINGEEVRALHFSLPPLAEQNEIVRRVETLFKFVDQIEARYQKAQAHVDKLTQSILAKAFRGELVPQDPDDEPATALLERIHRNKGK